MSRFAAGAPILLILASIIACSGGNDASVVAAPGSPMLGKSTVTDPTATFRFPMAGTNVMGDGAYSDGTNSVYADGACGVEAKIYATTAASNSGDATLATNGPRSKDHNCTVYPRHLTLVYPDGGIETGAGTNLRKLQNTTFVIPVGTTVTRALHIGTGGIGRCDGLVWSADRTGTPVAGDSVFVTRTSVDTWQVQSQPAPNNRAYCWPTGPSYNMNVAFTVTSSRPLP